MGPQEGVALRLKAVWRLIKAYPSTLWIPLLCLGVLATIGCVVVVTASNAQVSSCQTEAGEDAAAAAESMSQVLLGTVQPISSFGHFVETYPDFRMVNTSFPSLAAKLLAQVANAVNSTYLELVPFGTILNVYPVNSNTLLGMGLDLFSVPARIPQIITDIQSDSPTLRGPLVLYHNDPVTGLAVTTGLGLVAHYVVMLPAAANETWDIPTPLSPNCPADVCFNGTHKFWGEVAAVVQFESFVTEPSQALAALRSKGYSYRLLQSSPDIDPTPGYIGPDGHNATVLSSHGDDPIDPVSATVRVPGVSAFVPWTLYVSQPGGWTPSWKAPLLATVVIVSFILSAMLFFLLYYMRQHQQLLYSLVPRDTVETLLAKNSFHVDDESKGAQDRAMVKSGTPVELLLDVLSQVLLGKQPDLKDVVTVRAFFARGGGGIALHQPQDLSRQLRNNNNGLEDDVVQALVRELQGYEPAGSTASKFATNPLLGSVPSVPSSPMRTPHGTTLRMAPSTSSDAIESLLVGAVPDTAPVSTLEAALAIIMATPPAATATTAAAERMRPDATATACLVGADDSCGGDGGGGGSGGCEQPAADATVAVASELVLNDGRNNPGAGAGVAYGGGDHRGSFGSDKAAAAALELIERQCSGLSRTSGGSLVTLPMPPSLSIPKGNHAANGTVGLTLSPAAPAQQPAAGNSDRHAVIEVALEPLPAAPQQPTPTLNVSHATDRAVLPLHPSASPPPLPQFDGKGPTVSRVVMQYSSAPQLMRHERHSDGRTLPTGDGLPPLPPPLHHARGDDGGSANGGGKGRSARFNPSLGTASHASSLQPPGPGPHPPLVDRVVYLLEASYGAWSFDAFALEEATHGRPLSTLLYFLITRSGLVQALNLNAVKVARLAIAIEDGYQPNPYHNKTHAADVLQTMHTLILRSGFIVGEGEAGYCDPPMLLACLLAAASHDLEHMGMTNDFLIHSEDDLALLYSDKSPMEHHHLACMFKLLKRPQLNILSHMPKPLRLKLRKAIIELIGATDMKHHFSISSQFSTLHRLSPSQFTPGAPLPRMASTNSSASNRSETNSGRGTPVNLRPHISSPAPAPPPPPPLLKSVSTFGRHSIAASLAALSGRPASGRPGAAISGRPGGHSHHAGGSYHAGSSYNAGSSYHAGSHHGGGGSRAVSGYPDSEAVAAMPTPVPMDEAEHLLSLQVALKCADIGSLAESRKVTVRWVTCLEEEFFAQGDKERALGLPISPLFDRDKPGVSKSQIGFYDVVALPLFHNYSCAFPGARPLFNRTMDNYRYWQRTSTSKPPPK